MIAINDKVVCINDRWNTTDYVLVNPPKKDCVYCVESLRVSQSGKLGLYIVGSKSYGKGADANIDMGWNAKAFRKLEDVKMENELNYYKSQVFNK